ncbi:MAG: Uncharacterised protein [Marine Group II euryarchaeote MED-G33]|nr:MAG: Uncharacterised protein [Marine Group II euryarchaeote MED-G33]
MSAAMPSASVMPSSEVTFSTVATISSAGIEGMRICCIRLRSASIIRLGARAVKMKRLVWDSDSIIRRRYGWRRAPRWSASSIIINRLTGARPNSTCVSSPHGASPTSPDHMFRSNASRLVRLAKVSEELRPAGRRNSSKVFMAPDCLAKSLAWRM